MSDTKLPDSWSRPCRVRTPARVVELDRQFVSLFLYAELSAGGPARPRRHRRGRGRKYVPRFRRRNRRGVHGALPSGSGRRHPEAGRRTHSHVRHGFLLPEPGRTGAEARRDCARARAEARLLRQFRHGGRRSGHQAGALPHPARKDRGLLRRLSRAHHGLAVADGIQAGAAPGLRFAALGRLSRAVPEFVSLPVREAGGVMLYGVRGVSGEAALQEDHRSPRSRSDFHRADSGRRRLPARAV